MLKLINQMLVRPLSNRVWAILMIVMPVILLLDIIIQDPLPFLDEAFLFFSILLLWSDGARRAKEKMERFGIPRMELPPIELETDTVFTDFERERCQQFRVRSNIIIPIFPLPPRRSLPLPDLNVGEEPDELLN